MKRVLHRVTVSLVLALGVLAAGCTPLERGVYDGINKGFNSAMAALITAPVEYLIDQWLAGAN